MVHRDPPSSISPWLSAPRITLLVASFFVALGSGTNYVYSAYSPQLGTRLNISYTQLNIVGLAGNAGVYCSAPVWGKIVDSRGPRIILIVSCAFLLGGYSGIKYFYDSGLPPDTNTLPALSFYLLVLCSFLTGSGSLGGITSSLNSTVKSFPDGARASTTGLVMAGFGLSAFFFTALSNILFSSTTSTFLLTLALGTSSVMILGFFLVRPVPLPEEASSPLLEGGDDVREPLLPAPLHHNYGRTTLLNDEIMKDRHAHYTRTDINTDGEHSNFVGGAVEVTRSIQTSDRKRNTVNIYGQALCRSLDFWLLFSIYSLLAGTGYTYINNVGSMSRCLYAHDNLLYNEAQALRWQAAQVSAISLLNFGGRIMIGFFSDFAKRLYKTPRSHSLALVSFLCLISQVVAANVSNISNLWIASALLGLAHGSVSALLPTVSLEWFGLPHFSENWGYLCISPVFSANLLAFLFGRILDAHRDKSFQDLSPSAFHAYGGPPRCLQGRDCYVDAIYLTIGATFLSLLISLWAGYRDSQKADNGGGDIVVGQP
ncbi:MFS general substrate transporter [Phlegmacium glaucopus]|nr:MFS general substrate transporter [Phlegmacium glaucopus]